jgi:hypothetical protein
MPSLNRFATIGLLVVVGLAWHTACRAWECDGETVAFTHRPSDYYGSGEYVSVCPDDTASIRCYHYHRHWICQKEASFFWDRNLASAARTACGCPLPEGTAPSSPSVSTEPETRFYDFP